MLSRLLIGFSIGSALLINPVGFSGTNDLPLSPARHPLDQQFCLQEKIHEMICALLMFLNREHVVVQTIAKTKTAALFGYENIVDERWVQTSHGTFEAILYRATPALKHKIDAWKKDSPFNRKTYWATLPLTPSMHLFIKTWLGDESLFRLLQSFTVSSSGFLP